MDETGGDRWMSRIPHANVAHETFAVGGGRGGRKNTAHIAAALANFGDAMAGHKFVAEEVEVEQRWASCCPPPCLHLTRQCTCTLSPLAPL